MKVVKFLAQVDKAKCTGDKLCETVCPTGAIQVEGKKAAVDAKKCVSCCNCSDICQEEAVTMASPPPRISPCISPRRTRF